MKYFIIRNGDENAGFLAYVKFALNGIVYAENHDMIPVVNFDNRVKNHFYDENKGSNTWEYYFDPVSQISTEEIFNSPAQTSTLKDRQFRNQNSHPNPDRMDTFWKGKKRWQEHEGDPIRWLHTRRLKAQKYIKKYIHPKQHILDIVDNFVDTNLGEGAIACHVRGTDFAYATPVHPTDYFEKIDNHSDSCQIFLATDQTQYVDMFKTRYGDRVVTYDSLRSSDDTAIFEKTGQNYKKGEDVLVDTLIMSRCSGIIKCAAAGGEFAIWFNENIDIIHDFAVDCKFCRGGHWDRENTAFHKLNISDDL